MSGCGVEDAHLPWEQDYARSNRAIPTNFISESTADWSATGVEYRGLQMHSGVAFDSSALRHQLRYCIFSSGRVSIRPMKATAKAKRTTAKPKTRTSYMRDWHARHPGIRLRFDDQAQFDHIKSAVATIQPNCSLNLFILEAAVSRANTVLLHTPSPAPA
jgi:hypothetical protein